MRKKLLSVALCATMVAGLLAGCGSSSKSDKASSDSKGSVYWLNFKPEADEALQGIAKTYEKENGVKVKVVTAASGNYNSTLTSEMGKSAAPTLFVVGNNGVGKSTIIEALSLALGYGLNKLEVTPYLFHTLTVEQFKVDKVPPIITIEVFFDNKKDEFSGTNNTLQ